MLFDSSALSQFPGFQVVAEFPFNLPINEIMAMITSNEKPKIGSESSRIDLPPAIGSSNPTPVKSQPTQAPPKNAIPSNKKPKNFSESNRIDLPVISSSNPTPVQSQPFYAPPPKNAINQTFQQTEAEKQDFLNSIGLEKSGESLR